MTFNSSVLSYDSERHMTDMNNIVENARKSDNDLFVYSLLEFNDSVHDIDTIDKISYYRALTEASGNDLIPVNEGIVEVVNSLAKIIAKIIDFLKDISKKIFNFNIFGKNRYKQLKKKDPKNSSENSWFHNPNVKRQINVYHFPDINDINSQEIKSCLNNIIDELEKVCENYTSVSNKASNSTKAIAFNTLAKLIAKSVSVEGAPNKFGADNVWESNGFNYYIKTELCFITQKEMDYNDYYHYWLTLSNHMRNANEYARKVSEFNKELDRAKKIVSNAIINTSEQKKHANDLVSQISAISTSYANFIYMIANIEKNCFDYHSKIAAKYIYCEDESIEEAGWIHGEQFDSDTLFDNEDLRDFNRTEWLDLNLTTECFESKYEILETSKRIALQEALILTDDLPNKFGRLVAMREAEEKKLSDRLSNIIEAIRNALNKFMQAVKDKATQQATKLKNNATFITKPIKIEHVKSNGDILAGMYRIQQKINILPFDYNSMKDDLKDKETFFRNRILSGMRNTSQYAKRQLNWNEGMSVTEYYKLYYGASLPEDKYPKCEFTTQELEINKANIIKFLSTPNNAFSCKSDLDVLESESKKIARADAVQNQQQDVQTTTQNTEQKPVANDATAKNEAYFSELYQTWFTEAEIEMGEKPAEAEQNNQEIADRATAYKIYMDTYKDIILSKMTAAEFIYSELTQIINAHAAYYAPKAKPAATTQNNPQSQATPAQQQTNK